MKKFILFIVPLLFFSSVIHAQYFLGLRSSNFGGVTNVNYNPAIADNHFIADINLFAAGVNFNNNYVGIDGKSFNHLWNLDFSDPNFQDNYLHERLNGKAKNVYLGLQVQGPLSFMFSFGKKNENAIALTYHANTILNVDNVEETLARIMYYGIGTRAEQFFHKQLSSPYMGIKEMSWMDYGITYSRTVFDNGPHFLKAGATLKVLQGLMSVYLNASDLKYKWETFDTLDIFKTTVNYGHSDNVYFDNNYQPKYKFTAKPTIGADLAVVYEWRPKKDKYKYEMDGRTDLYRRDKDLYTLQVGFSVIDIGRLNFTKGQLSQDFYADITNWNVHNFNASGAIQSIDDTIHSRFTTLSGPSSFKMWLPTKFNLWIDAQVGLGFGFNLAASVSPVMPQNKNQVHQVSVFSLTPHYDHAWFGAYLPVSYDVFGNVNFGATLRLGPLIIGTQDLLGLMGAKKWVYNADVHVALKIPIPYCKPHDKDKDHVSNKKDKCPKIPGPWATHGCPDRDSDGVVDTEDKCPDTPGPVALHGCPDTDGDGIIDLEDSCVFEKGLAQFHGCPDRDSDGITDKLDECPDVPGLAEFNGCPDRDKDGTPDKTDLCPDVPGPKDHFGCPDSDKDGVYDNEDHCVLTPGPKENGGCPWPDRDGDGVLDKDDDCPDVFGVAENKGCPKLEKKEIETLKYAFENLEFETGKDIIRKHSYPSLSGLAELLVKKESYGLLIEGHTDNVGTDENNLILSQKRANAVKNYLIAHGVEGSKLQSFGYGESRPIADNDTPEGRQKNRRVEMKITFK